MTDWASAGRALLDEVRGAARGSGLSGAIGDALFACALGDPDPLVAHEWIQRAIDELEAEGTDASLHRGITGLGMLIATYRPEEEGLLAYVDEVASSRLPNLPPASLQSGAPGVALYASLRSGVESGRSLQRAVVDAMRASAVPLGGGLVWYTPADYADARGMKVLGEPILELGIMHGVAGALVGLAALAARGAAGAADLARAGIHATWSLAKDGDPNRFGRVTFGPGGASGVREYELPRWCVGDAGVLRALWIASRALDDAPSAQRALVALRSDAAREATERRDRLEGRLDLCCGAAGVAHVYQRMHRETRDGVFRDASAMLLARCAEGYDDLGFTTFLYGKMGIVAAQLAAERDEDPVWDGILGMSLPAQPPRAAGGASS